jgi:uncharacterized membrane protein
LETHRRSIAKAAIWRIIATTTTASIAWAVTGEVRFAVIIGGGDAALKMILFYLHERVWNRVKFGRV